MAKVPFTKLKCKINTDEIPVQIGEETIAIKQYLPIQDKLALIGRVIEYAHMQDENYSNPVKAGVLRDLEVVYAYTNISFTEKQKEDVTKLYDQLYSSGILAQIIKNVPTEEYEIIVTGVNESIEAVYKYQNSVFGILDGLKQDYSNVDLDISKLGEKFADPNMLETVKDVLTKLG